MTADQIEQAYFAAIAVWESSDPRLQFDYLGNWAQPGFVGDGKSVFAWGSGVQTSTDGNGYLIEADIQRDPQSSADTWTPCQQQDGSCTDTASATWDLQDGITHELGHALGLADLSDTPDSHFLTMQHEARVHERFRNTLALGDVLGVRHLYPTDAPMPTIYDP